MNNSKLIDLTEDDDIEVETVETEESASVEEPIKKTGDFLEDNFGIKNWTPPGGNNNPEFYELYIIDKQSRKIFLKSLKRDNEHLKQVYSRDSFWHLELINGKLINVDPEYLEKYQMIMDKAKEEEFKYSDSSITSELATTMIMIKK